jgi:hypothetical protein
MADEASTDDLADRPDQPDKTAQTDRPDQTNQTDRPSLSIGGDDWPAQVADTIVRVVDQVRVKTTDNVVLLVRGIVYGLVVGVLGLAIVVMTTVALLRLADAYLPIGDGVGSATWAAHGLLGLLLSVLGFGTWMSRTGSMKPLVLAAMVDVAILLGIVFYGVIDGVS